jgi:hypothetical protein
MSKYQYTPAMDEISGFGGGYEETCRKMVIAGVEWADKKGNANPTWKESPQVTGITIDENDDAKELQKVMCEASGNDCTGAMMQACMNHVLYVMKNGWDKYVETMSKKESA